MKRIIIYFFLALNPILLISQNVNKEGKDNNIKHYNVSTLSINDSCVYAVLDSVLVSERNGKYYSQSVCYCIRVYKQDGKKENVIKIEGSDNSRLFIGSKDLIGFFKYGGHDFFLLTQCHELFSKTNKTVVYEFEQPQRISEDDRWAIYYFSYDEANYYFHERVNYTPK